MAALEGNATSAPAADDNYPSGPITCCVKCLSRGVRVRQGLTWTVSLIIAWLTSFVALALFAAAFGTVAWASATQLKEGRTVVIMIGLWKECHSDNTIGCYISDMETNGAGMKAAQGVAVICLLGIIIECVLTTFYVMFPDTTTNHSIGVVAVWSKLACFLAILILLPVFAETWYKPKHNSAAHSLEYSFILVVITFVVEGFSMFFMYCDVIVFKGSHKRLVESKAVDDYPGEDNQGFADSNSTGAFPADGSIPQNHPEKSVSLVQQVQGTMDAKAAYENFAFDHPETQVQHPGYPNPSLNVTRDSDLFEKEGVGKRFPGLTLAEPEYASVYGSHTTLATVQDDLECAPDRPHLPNVQHDIVDASPAMVRRMQDMQWSNKPTTASMQNIYNESMQLQKDQSGKFITSVSMYNLTDDSEKGKGDRDQFSMRSWHPERPGLSVFHPDASFDLDSPNTRAVPLDHRGSVQDVRRLSSQQSVKPLHIPSYPSQATLTHVSTHSLHAPITDTQGLIAQPRDHAPTSPQRSSNEDVRPKQRRNSSRRKKANRKTEANENQAKSSKLSFQNSVYNDEPAIPLGLTNPASIASTPRSDISETSLNDMKPKPFQVHPGNVRTAQATPQRSADMHKDRNTATETPNLDRQPPEGQSRELDKPFPNPVPQERKYRKPMNPNVDSIQNQNQDRLSPEGQISDSSQARSETTKPSYVDQVSKQSGQARLFERKPQPENAVKAPSRRRRDKLQQQRAHNPGNSGPAPLSRAKSTPEINMTYETRDKAIPSVTPTNMIRGRSMNALNIGELARAKSTTSLHSIGGTSMVSGCAETEI